MKSHFHVVPVYNAITESDQFAVMFYVEFMNRNYLMKTYQTKKEARDKAYNLMCDLETNGFMFSVTYLASKENYPVYQTKIAHYENESEFPF